MRSVCLICIGMLAILWDFYTRRIPNLLTIAGLIAGAAWQWSANGPPGIGSFLGGALLPLLVLGILHYFKMMGAGDLKYFMVVGGFFEPSLSLKCICISFLIAAIFSLAVIVKHRILMKRLYRLIHYIKEYISTGIWKPYISETENLAYLHMSLPIFLGSMLVTGGWI